MTATTNVASFLGLSAVTNKAVKGFDVKNVQAGVKISAAVIPETVYWDEQTRSVRVLCNDGNIRVMRVDRAESLEFARNVTKNIQKAIKAGKEIHFHAAGGFSPNAWFFDVSMPKAK